MRSYVLNLESSRIRRTSAYKMSRLHIFRDDLYNYANYINADFNYIFKLNQDICRICAKIWYAIRDCYCINKIL